MERALRLHPRSDKPWAAAIPSRVIVKSLSQRRARFRVVRDENRGHSALGVELPEQIEDGLSRRRVEIAGRLVGEEESRARERARARSRRAAARRPRARGRRGARRSARPTRASSSPASRRAARLGNSRDAVRHRDVLFGRELRQEVMELEHESDLRVAESGPLARRELVEGLAEDFDAARVRPVDAADQVQERRLARRPRDPSRRRTSRPGARRRGSRRLSPGRLRPCRSWRGSRP